MRDHHDTSFRPAQTGFTLIEVMLVVVLAGVFAVMVSLSVSGSEVRKAMQEREQLADSLAMIRLESADQGRMLGLVTVDETSSDPARYAVVEYDPAAATKNQRWRLANDFKPHDLPHGMGLIIRRDDTAMSAQESQALEQLKIDSVLSPDILWYGNGEATPGRLQLLLEGQPVGDALTLSSIGQVEGKGDASK